MRVLLSDGSGLTARQCASQLAAAGHEVGGRRLRVAGATGC